MQIFNRRLFMQVSAGLSALALVNIGTAPARAEVQGLEIMAPSGPGSGYDQLARSIQAALEAEKLASGVQVKNVAGGGGTVGLAQFTTGKARHASTLVVGFALVGGILTTKSAVNLDPLIPLGRLMGEADVIVVPANSDIKTLSDLVAKLKADPGSVSWAGGSIGGFDHVLVGLIAKTAGVDPKKINYVVHAGGGEVLASTLGGHATVGVSGVEEFRSQIASGQLRALAVSSDTRAKNLDVPTLKEAGLDLAMMNWRGILAHPNTSEEDRRAMTDAIAKMVTSASWKKTLEERGWADTYLPPEEFGVFLKEETQRVEGALKDVGIIE